jgi:hypothetical protein
MLTIQPISEREFNIYALPLTWISAPCFRCWKATVSRAIIAFVSFEAMLKARRDMVEIARRAGVRVE